MDWRETELDCSSVVQRVFISKAIFQTFGTKGPRVWGRVERHRSQGTYSVTGWFGASCDLLALVIGHSVIEDFYQSTLYCLLTRFMDILTRFQQDLVPKLPNGLLTTLLLCLSQRTWPEPHTKSGGINGSKTPNPIIQMNWRLSKKPGLQ